MCKSDLVNKVLTIVEQETEISVDEIRGGGKSSDIVDARYLAVYFLIKAGFYPRSIAEILHIKSQSVNRIYRNFKDHHDYGGVVFDINFQHIEAELKPYLA